jgi:hypothetical protein
VAGGTIALPNAAACRFIRLRRLSTPRKAPDRLATWAFIFIAAAAFALLASTYWRVYTPAFGLTKLLGAGSEFNARGLAAYRATPKYLAPDDRWGFDGQYYAQLALDPLLRDPQLQRALDDPRYRARRILVPWLAWLGGWGRPAWILNVYAALNLVFWVGFAALLAVLFRPHGWAGLAGFAALLMTCGIIESMRVSLVDFPAFVLQTSALLLGGAAGAGVLALATLARETSLFGLVGLWEYRPPWSAALRGNLRLALIAGVPWVLWLGYVAWRLRVTSTVDGENMDWPLRGMMAKLGEVSVRAAAGEIPWGRWYAAWYSSEPVHAVLTIVATLTQCAFLLTHREWSNRFWRVGAFYVPFFLCIGFLSWTTHFTVTRHALPITLAFNLVLARRARRTWPVWFLLGNCFVPFGVHQFLVGESGTATIPAEYRIVDARPAGAPVAARFDSGWSVREWDRAHAWRWAVGRRAEFVLVNPAPQAAEVALSFVTRSVGIRELEVRVAGANIWAGHLTGTKMPVRTSRFRLPPGETVVSLLTPLPPVAPASADTRLLSFMVEDLQIDVAEPAAP